MVTHFEPLKPSDRCNVKILKIQHGSSRYSEKNGKIASLTDGHHPTVEIRLFHVAADRTLTLLA